MRLQGRSRPYGPNRYRERYSDRHADRDRRFQGPVHQFSGQRQPEEEHLERQRNREGATLPFADGK